MKKIILSQSATGSINSLTKNLKTIILNPVMFVCWVRWLARYVGFNPRIKQPLGGHIGGFRSFSEFWGAINGPASPEEIAYFDRFAGNAGVILDVGANLGCLSLTMSKCRPRLPLHAFEPSPDTASILQSNLDANGASNIVLHNLAVGQTIGRLPFRNNTKSAPTNRIVNAEDLETTDLIYVNVTSLDQFLEDHGITEVALLKIDVEGFETNVLKGAQRLFRERRCKAALIEFCPNNLSAAGSNVQELLGAVEDLGCSIYYLQADGSPGAKVTLESSTSIDFVNVAMLPSS